MSAVRSRSRRGRRLPAVLLLALLGALLFLAGLGLGRALTEAPAPGGEVTYERDLEPLPLGETATVTVIVTVTAP